MKFFLYVRSLLDLTASDSPIQLGPFLGLKVDHSCVSVLRKLEGKEREAAKRRDDPEKAWFQVATAEIAYKPSTYTTDAEGKPIQKNAPSSGTVWTFIDPKDPKRPPIKSIEWSIDV